MNRTRMATTVAATLSLAALTTGAATAQSPVSVSTGYADAHGHVLEVKDLTGANLTAVALRPGEPQTFRVGVRTSAPTDLTKAPQALHGYTVESSMTHLYGTSGGSVDYSATKIPSSEVSVSYATSPLEVRDALANVSPSYLLSSPGAITCSAINGVGGLTKTLNLVTDPLCLLLGGTGATLTDVPLAGAVVEDVDLRTLAPTELPLVPAAGVDKGAFTSPDCVASLGATDTSCGSSTRGTQHTMLAAAPATAIDADLTALVSTAVGTLPLASADGTNAKASVDQVLTAMQLSGDSTVSSLGSKLAQDFGVADQVRIINSLMSVTGPVLDQVTDVLGIGALANAFPSLKVDPTTATSGTYTGTLTIRLIECPACP